MLYTALAKLGASANMPKLTYRSPFGMIGVKGGEEGTADDELPEPVADDTELSPHSKALMTTSSLASSPGSRFYSLTEEVKLTAPGEGKSLPFGGFHAIRRA